MSSISKNSIVTFFTRITMFLFGLIASIILARALGPAGKGTFALIVLIPAIMVKVASLGFEVSNAYFVGSKSYAVKDIISHSLFSSIFLGVISVVVFWGIIHTDGFQSFLQSNQIEKQYVWLIVLTVPFSLMFLFFSAVFVGREEIGLFNKINVFQAMLNLGLIIIFLLLLKQGILGAVFSYVITAICCAVLVIFLMRTSAKVSFGYKKKLFDDSVRYGIKAYAGNLAQFLNYRIDMLLVALFLSPAAVGYYSIAVLVAEKIWMLPESIATVVFSRILSLNDLDANSLAMAVARYTFFFLGGISLLIGFFASPLIKVFFGTSFLPSVKPLLILLPGIIILGGAKILTAGLSGRGKPQFGTYASFASLAVNIILNLYLIPRWGISGAAFASTISYSIAGIIVVASFSVISKKSWADIMVVKREDFLKLPLYFSEDRIEDSSISDLP